MPEVKSVFREVLPKKGLSCNTITCVKDERWLVSLEKTQEVLLKRAEACTGQLSVEDVPTMILCKPKLLPLKSVTLEKLEKMQMEAQEAVRQQELATKEQPQ